MRIEPLIPLALLFACSSDRPAPQPDTPPVKVECERDPQCVGTWNPSVDGCGPVERCYDGACIRPPAMTGVPNPQTAQVEFQSTPPRAYQVELVRDSFETSRGLMCRDSMKEDWGMLFEMPVSRVQRFWMKNTLIPLDIVFIDEDWKVVGSVTAQPLTLTGRGVDAPSRYVLELKAGETARHHLTPGTVVRYFPPAAQ